MAKYAINQEGAQALWELAAGMERIQAEIENACDDLQQAVVCREDQLGIYADRLLEWLGENRRILEQAEDEVLDLAATAKRYAELVEDFLAKGLQAGMAGGGHPLAGKGGSQKTSIPSLSKNTISHMLGQWDRIHGSHSQKEDLAKTNPQWKSGEAKWTKNCQHCVPAYEMRRRGYDVEALPAKALDRLTRYPFEVWENPNVIHCKDNGYGQIQDLMLQWGDGARCQIVVCWARSLEGHTFVAEQINGQTRFYDPQTGEEDVSWYFSNVADGQTRVARIDHLQPNKYITDCCTKARKSTVP